MRVSNVTVRKRLIFILISGILIFTIIDIRLGYVQFFSWEYVNGSCERFMES